MYNIQHEGIKNSIVAKQLQFIPNNIGNIITFSSGSIGGFVYTIHSTLVQNNNTNIYNVRILLIM